MHKHLKMLADDVSGLVSNEYKSWTYCLVITAPLRGRDS